MIYDTRESKNIMLSIRIRRNISRSTTFIVWFHIRCSSNLLSKIAQCVIFSCCERDWDELKKQIDLMKKNNSQKWCVISETVSTSCNDIHQKDKSHKRISLFLMSENHSALQFFFIFSFFNLSHFCFRCDFVIMFFNFAIKVSYQFNQFDSKTITNITSIIADVDFILSIMNNFAKIVDFNNNEIVSFSSLKSIDENNHENHVIDTENLMNKLMIRQNEKQLR